jgi:RNA recognition motif-containing protein
VTEISIPLDSDTGRPRGYAYLRMQDEIDAVTALHMLDGRSLHEQKIQVSRTADEEADDDAGGSPATRPAFKRFKSKGSRRGVRGRKRSL